MRAGDQKFVRHIHENEPGTLVYISLQQKDDATRFIHYMVFKNAAAQKKHTESTAVKQFVEALYPNCVAPVEFTDYDNFASR